MSKAATIDPETGLIEQANMLQLIEALNAKVDRHHQEFLNLSSRLDSAIRGVETASQKIDELAQLDIFEDAKS